MKFNISFYCVMILLIILLSGCSDDKKDIVVPEATVKITLEAEGGASTEGAFIFLTNTDPNPNQLDHKASLTWGQTEIVFEDVKHGSYTLTASHPDFKYFMEHIEIKANEVTKKLNLSKNVETNVSNVVVDLKIRYKDGGDLTGTKITLANNNRNKLKGLYADTLEVLPLSSAQAQTQATVRFPGMVHGYYTLNIQQKEYAAVEIENIIIDKSGELKINDMLSTMGLDEHTLSLVNLTPRTRLTLAIKTADNKPLKGTKVVLKHNKHAVLTRTLNLDELANLDKDDEDYENFDSSVETSWTKTFYDMIYGEYDMSVQNKDYIYVLSKYHIQVPFFNRSYSMVANHPDSLATVRFPIGRRFPDGNEYTGATVSLKNNNGNPAHVFTYNVTSADTANHFIANVPYGGYEFKVTFPSDGKYFEIEQPNLVVTNKVVRRPVSLVSKSDNTSFDVTIRRIYGPTYTISVAKTITLIPQEDLPPNLPVYTGAASSSVHTFRFNNVIYGNYILRITGVSDYVDYETEVIAINADATTHTAFMIPNPGIKRKVTINLVTPTNDFTGVEVSLNLKYPFAAWPDTTIVKDVTVAGNGKENVLVFENVPRNLYVLSISHEDIVTYIKEFPVIDSDVTRSDTLRVATPAKR